MNDNSRFGEANQDLLSVNATRPNEQGAGMSHIPPGGQGASGSGTAQQADVIPSSLNSLQGSQQGSVINGGVEGGIAPMLFPVPGFNSVGSMRFIDESGALFGVVGSLDADAGPMRVPPQTGSFVFGPLIYSSLWHDEASMAIIRTDARSELFLGQMRCCRLFWGHVWPQGWERWALTIGTSPRQAVREARLQVARMWVAGGAQDLMWLAPINEASVRGAAGRAPYVPAPIQEEVIRALSDEEQTVLFACVAFAFGSPSDGGLRGSVNPRPTAGTGIQVNYAQQATVNPDNFMVYSDVPNEWQPFQSAEIDLNGLVNINFSSGRWLTVTHTAIRPIDQSQLGKEWNERIFGPRLAAAHRPRPPAPVGLTAEEFRGLTEVLGTARSPEDFIQSAQRMSITVRKALERTFALTLVDSHRAMSQVAEVGMPYMLRTLLNMQAEGSITLEASPNVRLNKVQRTAHTREHNWRGTLQSMAQQCSRRRRGNAARDSPVRVGHTVDGGATGVYCTSVRSSSRAYAHLWGGRLGHTGWLANTSFQRGRGWRFIWIREWGDARPRVWDGRATTQLGVGGASGACCKRLDSPLNSY